MSNKNFDYCHTTSSGIMQLTISYYYPSMPKGRQCTECRAHFVLQPCSNTTCPSCTTKREIHNRTRYEFWWENGWVVGELYSKLENNNIAVFYGWNDIQEHNIREDLANSEIRELQSNPGPADLIGKTLKIRFKGVPGVENGNYVGVVTNSLIDKHGTQHLIQFRHDIEDRHWINLDPGKFKYSVIESKQPEEIKKPKKRSGIRRVIHDDDDDDDPPRESDCSDDNDDEYQPHAPKAKKMRHLNQDVNSIPLRVCTETREFILRKFKEHGVEEQVAYSLIDKCYENNYTGGKQRILSILHNIKKNPELLEKINAGVDVSQYGAFDMKTKKQQTEETERRQRELALCVKYGTAEDTGMNKIFKGECTDAEHWKQRNQKISKKIEWMKTQLDEPDARFRSTNNPGSSDSGDSEPNDQS